MLQIWQILCEPEIHSRAVWNKWKWTFQDFSCWISNCQQDVRCSYFRFICGVSNINWSCMNAFRELQRRPHNGWFSIINAHGYCGERNIKECTLGTTAFIKRRTKFIDIKFRKDEYQLIVVGERGRYKEQKNLMLLLIYWDVSTKCVAKNINAVDHRKTFWRRLVTAVVWNSKAILWILNQNTNASNTISCLFFFLLKCEW